MHGFGESRDLPAGRAPTTRQGGRGSATLLRKPRQFRTNEASGTRHSTAAPQRPKTLHPLKIQPILQKDIKNRIPRREKNERTENCRGENVKTKRGTFSSTNGGEASLEGHAETHLLGTGRPSPSRDTDGKENGRPAWDKSCVHLQLFLPSQP